MSTFVPSSCYCRQGEEFHCMFAVTSYSFPPPESPVQAQAPEGAAFGSDFEVTTAFPWGKFTLTSGHIGPRQNAMGAQRVEVPATLFPHLYHGLVRNVTVCSPHFSSRSRVAECRLHEVVSPTPHWLHPPPQAPCQ